MRRTVGVWALLLAASLVAGGCGRHAATVTGDVTLGGQPLTSGVVTYTPVGPGASAYGNVGSDGTYRLQTGAERGLEPGEYKVTVAANANAEQAAAMGITIGREGIMPLLTPRRYADISTTPLQVTVRRGRQTINLALEDERRGAKP